MNIITETGHGTGAIPDAPDVRNFKWGEQIGDVTVPFDWTQAYDIELEIAKALGFSSFKMYVDDQGSSGSCGGQAIRKKGEAVAAIHNKKYVRKSAKFPYSQVFVPPAGSAAKPLFAIYGSEGMGTEGDTPSYILGNVPDEAFMERVGDITPEARNNAKTDKSAVYAEIKIDIDSVAQAIRDSGGVILGINGQNNGSWRTPFPLPPTSDDIWRHWVYTGKAMTIAGKKYVGFINSWGIMTGDQGWQWISEDYFKNGIFAVWTFVYDTTVASGIFTRTVRMGMTGEDVAFVQKITGANIDSRFGKQTLSHVKQFQTAHGLKTDGIVGKLTQAKLLEVNQASS